MGVVGDVVERPFNSHQVSFAVTNPLGRELVSITFFQDGSRVGRILSGEAIGPGSFASLVEDQIELYVNIANIPSILRLLKTQARLVLFSSSRTLPANRTPSSAVSGLRRRTCLLYTSPSPRD